MEMTAKQFVLSQSFELSSNEVIARAKARGIELTGQAVAQYRRWARMRSVAGTSPTGAVKQRNEQSDAERELSSLIRRVGIDRARRLLAEQEQAYN